MLDTSPKCNRNYLQRQGFLKKKTGRQILCIEQGKQKKNVRENSNFAAEKILDKQEQGCYSYSGKKNSFLKRRKSIKGNFQRKLEDAKPRS
jgi:hypothetical protein